MDDEEIFLHATKIYLEKTTGGEIQIDSLINPEQVFEKLEKKKYDVIVADYIMPPMNGLQLLEQLRNQKNNIPYIILTGRGREEIVIKALNLGANRYIKKGMDTESQFSELLHAIEEVVHHKRTHEALQESEMKFRSLIANLSEIVVEADAEGVFRYVSPQVFDILGYKPEELIGRSGFDHVHPDDMERAMEIIENALKGKTIFNFEYRKKHKDGHYIWASSSGRFDKENKLVFVIKDITDQIRTELALREEEERFQKIFEECPLGMALIHLDTTQFKINNAFCSMMDYSEAELIKLTFNDFTHPDDVVEDRKNVEKLLKGEIPVYQTEKRYIKKNNDVFWVNTTISIYRNSNGDPPYFIAMAEDITERKQAEDSLKESEEKYREILDNITDGYFEVDLAGNLSSFNKKLCTFLGYDSKELLGMNNRQYMDKITAKMVYQAFNRLYRTEKPITGLHYEIIKKDGTKRFSEISAFLRFDSKGEPIGFWGIHRDITEIKQAEEVLNTRLKLEQLGARLASEFVNFPLEEMDHMITNTLKDIAEFAGAVRSSVFLFSEDLQTVTNTHEWCENPENSQIALLQNIPSDIFGYYWELLKRKKNVVVSFKTDLPPEAESEWEWIRKHGWQSALFVPLVFEGRLYGALGFYGELGEERQWFDDLISLLLFVAPILTNAFERKKMEEALRESEEKYRTFVENFQGIAFQGSEDFSADIFTGNVEEITGYTEDDFVSGKIVYNQLIHPEDFQRVNDDVEEFIASSRRSTQREYRILDKGGKIHWVLESIQKYSGLTGKKAVVSGTLQDITDRIQAEKDLKESERRLRNLINSATDSIALWDSNLNLIDCNAVMLEMSTENTTKKDIIGKNLADFDPRMKERGEYAQFLEVIQTGKSLTLEGSISSPKRGRMDLQITAFKVGDGLGIITSDITMRKQAEQALFETKEKYQMLVEKLEEGVLLEDAEGKISFVNPKTTDLLGYMENELLGKHWTYIVSAETSGKVKTEIIKRSEGISSSYEINLQAKDQSLIPVIVSASPIFSESDEFSGVLSVFTNVSEQKQVEKKLIETKNRLEYLLKSSPAVIYTCDPKSPYGITSISENVKEMTGYDPQDYLADPNFMDDRIHPEDRERIIASLNEISKQGNFLAVYRFRHKNGSYRWMLEESKLIHNEQGNVLDLIGSWGDITRQKQAEKDLLLVNQELRDFSSIVAHDLKAPLRNMKTIVNWLLRDSSDELNEEGKDHLTSLIKQTTHMDALIDGIWQYSRIDRLQKEIMNINLNDLLSEIIGVLSPPDNITINPQAKLPILAVDRTHITQIFSNLIENAIKFMDKPKGHIYINCEDKKSLWQFSVTDNGPGIDEGQFKRIFQMFQTLGPWDETKGTGIGLAIVKKIVELNGGKVWLESTVGEGSTFFFTMSKGMRETQ